MSGDERRPEAEPYQQNELCRARHRIETITRSNSRLGAHTTPVRGCSGPAMITAEAQQIVSTLGVRSNDLLIEENQEG